MRLTRRISFLHNYKTLFNVFLHRELPQYLYDVLIVNYIIIVSFVVRFGVEINLKEIYSTSAFFTYLTLIFTPVFLRVFYRHTDSYIISLISLVRSISLCSSVLLLINIIILPLLNFPIFKYRSMFVISWLLNILIFATIRLSFLYTYLHPLAVSKIDKTHKGSTPNVYAAFRALRPDAKDLKSLVIGCIASIIAFFIIYYIFGYK